VKCFECADLGDEEQEGRREEVQEVCGFFSEIDGRERKVYSTTMQSTLSHVQVIDISVPQILRQDH